MASRSAIHSDPPPSRSIGEWSTLIPPPLEGGRRQIRERLLWRIRRHYPTLDDPIRLILGGETVALPFTRVADPNRVLDEVAEEEDRLDRLRGHRRPDEVLHLPYWAELWDSAKGMAQWLIGPCQTPENTGRSLSDALMHSLAGRRVLDLGCGMGFTGMVAAKLGARVLFADLEAPALLFARLNSLADSDRVRTRQLNWQTTRLNETFDLILGCDILYERKQWDSLDAFWKRHLAAGGRVILGEPGRQTGDLFLPWVHAREWEVTLFHEVVESRSQPIRLFMLERKAADAAT